MRELPKGWAWASLGDLLLGIEAGKSPKCEPRPAHPGEWGVIKVSAMTYGEFRAGENKALPPGAEFNETLEIGPGDLLVSRANTEEYVGAAVLVTQCRSKLLLSDKSLRLVTANAVEKRWLYHVLSSPTMRRQFSERATGVKDSMRNLSQDSLRSVLIPVPPFSEQQRIVGALEEQLSRLDRSRDALLKVGGRIRRLRTRIVDSSVSGALTGDHHGGSAEWPEPAGVDDGDLPAIPYSWKWSRLVELAEIVGGVTKDSKKQSDPTFREVPYLRVANVQRGRIDLASVATIRVPEVTAERLLLRSGDVLLNEGGDRDKLGRGWIWEGQIAACIHQNHVFRARIQDGRIHPKLLAWYVNGWGRRWCEKNGKQSVNLASISLSKIRLLPIPIPPLNEQAAIVERVDEYLTGLDRCEQLVDAALKRLAALRRALLSAVFSGRLVPQDPADEPASVLLDRIRAERAAMPKPRRSRPTKAVPASTPQELPL